MLLMETTVDRTEIQSFIFRLADSAVTDAPKQIP